MFKCLNLDNLFYALGHANLKTSLVPRPSSLVGKNKGEEGLVELFT